MAHMSAPQDPHARRAEPSFADIGHGVLLGVAWALLGVLWFLVIRQAPWRRMVVVAAVVIVATIVNVALTQWWVWHNRRIYRRKGPRRAVPEAPFEYGVDAVARPVLADWDDVRSADIVLVATDENTKRFVAAYTGDAIHPEASPDEPLARRRRGRPNQLAPSESPA